MSWSTASTMSLKLRHPNRQSTDRCFSFWNRSLPKIYVDELPGQEKWNGETSFFESMVVVFRVGLCLGILPLSGLWQRRWEVVKFRWVSLQTMLAMVIIVGGYTAALCEFVGVARFTVSAKTMSKLERKVAELQP
jgi:Trehalose receptor